MNFLVFFGDLGFFVEIPFFTDRKLTEDWAFLGLRVAGIAGILAERATEGQSWW